MSVLMRALIRGYKRFISPLLPSSCVFVPTCSKYAYTAYREHGFFKGTFLTFKRLLRCNGINEGGRDPVPVNIRKTKWVL